MIKEVDKLFEAITGPGWEMNEKTDRLELYNFDRTRKLTYVGLNAGRGEVIADMGMYFLNENGGWDEVIDLIYSDFPDKVEKLTIMAMARGKNRPGMPLDYRFDYNNNGRWSRNAGNRGSTTDKRVQEDRQELLPSEDEMPERIDLDLTANLFVDQMIRGEMVRPVLVPEGMINEDWYFRPAEEFLRMAKDSQDPTEKKIYKAIARLLAKQQ